MAVDKNWYEEWAELTAEFQEAEDEWLKNGGSFICKCGRHIPCRRCKKNDNHPIEGEPE